jgi:hypothetical protein
MAYYSSGIAPGVAAEALSGACREREVYDAIVARKSTAYNLLLYRVALSGVKDQAVSSRLLTTLSHWAYLAQIMNDFQDFEEDAATGQPNPIRIVGETAAAELLRDELERCWQGAQALPKPLRNAFAARLYNTCASQERGVGAG